MTYYGKAIGETLINWYFSQHYLVLSSFKKIQNIYALRHISYEWGSMGERKSITYSDGNKTAITKDRRGLREESGRYEYGYDALSRLISVSRDGDALSNYVYDYFGNRSYLEDFESGTFYSFAASPSQAKEIIVGRYVPGYLSILIWQVCFFEARYHGII